MSKNKGSVTVRMNYAVRVSEKGGSKREYSAGFEYQVAPELAQEWVSKGSAVVVGPSGQLFQGEGASKVDAPEEAPRVPKARKVASEDKE